MDSNNKIQIQYKLANHLFLRLKRLIIVLNEIADDPVADESLIRSIRGGESGYIIGYNDRFISPFFGGASDLLSQLVLSKKYTEYLDLKLQEDLNEEKFLKVASYCKRGLSRGLSEWWAPSEISQEKKDNALDDVYKSAVKYIDWQKKHRHP